MMPNLLQYPIILLGILRAGMVVVNINPLYTSRELKFQLNDSGAKAIFIVSNFAKTLENIVTETAIEHVVLSRIADELTFVKRNMANFFISHIKKMVPKYHLPDAHSYRDALQTGENLFFHRPLINSDDIAFIQYTGGTTGVSKGAILQHKNMVASLMQATAVFGAVVKKGEDVVITALPLYHAFALTVNCLFFLHMGGKNILITNPRDIGAFIATLKKYPFDYFIGINTLFNALLNHRKFSQIDFSRLRITLSGGMATQANIATRWFEKTNSVVLDGYGLTECAPMVSVVPHNFTSFSGSIGYPLPSTLIRLRDTNNELVHAINVAGEIEIKGPQVMPAYWNNKQETDNAFIDGWFRSGDIGLFDEQGLLRLVDRKKDMILVSGFNVYPNEIESVISTIDGVLESAAVGVDSNDGSEIVKVFVVLRDYSITVKDIQAHCRDNLTAYKRPKMIEIVNELPKNNVGKVMRRLLKDR